MEKSPTSHYFEHKLVFIHYSALNTTFSGISGLFRKILKTTEFSDHSELVNVVDNYRRFSVIFRIKQVFQVWNKSIFKIKRFLGHTLPFIDYRLKHSFSTDTTQKSQCWSLYSYFISVNFTILYILKSLFPNLKLPNATLKFKIASVSMERKLLRKLKIYEEAWKHLFNDLKSKNILPLAFFIACSLTTSFFLTRTAVNTRRIQWQWPQFSWKLQKYNLLPYKLSIL